MPRMVGEDTSQTLTNKTIDGDNNTVVDAAPAVHTHTESDVTSLTTDLAAKADLVTGKVPTSQLPAIALTTVQTAASQAAMLALTTQEGDVVVRTDENKTYVRNAGTAGTMADFTLLNTPTDAVTSVNGQTGTVVLGKSNVGLANVDNTSDTSKPVSTAQQTALDLKAPLASPTFTGTVSGVTKSMVGLGNVDNTADSAKSFSASQIGSGTIAQARLGSGSGGTGTKFLADDQTYKTVNSSGGASQGLLYVASINAMNVFNY